MSTRQQFDELEDEVRDNEIITCAALMLIINSEKEEKRKRLWAHPYLLRRPERGMHQNLFTELAMEDPNRFRRCLRMDNRCFEYLLDRVRPIIQKQDTNMRRSIPPEERLSLTLRHLVTGKTQESLRLQFRISQICISGIIRDVCRAIKQILQPEYVREPCSVEEWKAVALEYEQKWNFPHCLGGMDGKHVKINPPLNSGSLFHNYKGDFSIVLLALVDAQLRFIFVDIGTNGRISDTGVWNKSTMKRKLENNQLHLPPAEQLPGTNADFPYVIVGDEGLPLSNHVMIPFPGAQCRNRLDRRIFNYRLSRARRCSENAFGVLGARFQIYGTAMRYDPDVAEDIVWATICLHNWLRSEAVNRAMYTPPAFIGEEDIFTGQLNAGEWREENPRGFANIIPQGGNHHGRDALGQRDQWCEYFNGVGAVAWQARMVR